ncbi:MAG: DUF2726 domain-containing protein, partial [Salinisphaeraceae bacterium]|nr:DUF2726 domain-containing protein [Salinisphaeraceae bacterium]
MNMLLLFFLVIACVAVLILKNGLPAASDYPYRIKSNSLLTKAERSFDGVLLQALDATEVLFAQVRVADVIAPVKGLSRSRRQTALNKITRKHFDFVICDANTLAVKLVIELDDASHKAPERRKRDHFLDESCKAAGLPLLHVRAARTYAVAELRSQIEQALNPQTETTEQAKARIAPSLDPEPVAKVEPTVNKTVLDLNPKPEEPQSPKCPNCGGNMTLR